MMAIKTWGAARDPKAPGTKKSTKAETRTRIVQLYSVEDQLNIISEAIASIGGGGTEFDEMRSFIESERSTHRKNKK